MLLFSDREAWDADWFPVQVMNAGSCSVEACHVLPPLWQGDGCCGSAPCAAGVGWLWPSVKRQDSEGLWLRDCWATPVTQSVPLWDRYEVTARRLALSLSHLSFDCHLKVWCVRGRKKIYDCSFVSVAPAAVGYFTFVKWRIFGQMG